MTTTQRIQEAVKTARHAGLAIQSGVYGVDRRIDGTWIPLPGRVVDPVGAFLLYSQCDSHPDPESCAATALEVSTQWVYGFVAGFDGEPFRSEKSARFIDGYEEGAMMAEEILQKCSIESHETLKADRTEFYRQTIPMCDEAGAPVVDTYGLEYRHCPKCGSTLAVQL